MTPIKEIVYQFSNWNRLCHQLQKYLMEKVDYYILTTLKHITFYRNGKVLGIGTYKMHYKNRKVTYFLTSIQIQKYEWKRGC